MTLSVDRRDRTTMLIESYDPVRETVESNGTLSDFREANAEDEEVLAALARLERGETTEELVGFSWLRLADVERAG